MFVNLKKWNGLVNGLILFAVVMVAAVAALAIVKIKRDPKNSDGYRNTLAFGKK